MVSKNIGPVEKKTLLFHFHEFEKEIKRKNIHTPQGTMRERDKGKIN